MPPLVPRVGSPASLGFQMPAEWEDHAATWLSWPHKETSWPGNFEPIPGIWVEIVRWLAPGESVHILVNDSAPHDVVVSQLRSAGVDTDNVQFFDVPTDDAWMRDHGPTFVRRLGQGRREIALIDWKYNAWGEKYPPWANDDVVPNRLQGFLKLQRFEPGIVLEGGSIDVNGTGTLLTTESCLLNPNRNPHLTRREIEQYLCDYLGVINVLWLGDGIVGDDTDGHIDDITRFVDVSTIVTATEEDPKDENYHTLAENLLRLRKMKNERGEPFRIETIPMPDPVIHEGVRLPASYANFYIGNRVVLVPVFGQQKDEAALSTLSRLFPNRQIAGIRANAMVWGLGAFHCVTQQQPA